MKLIRLELKNFKGIRNFALDVRGGDVSIWGDNASGKTSLFDAFCWLLFDKDSQNRKDFEIKTLDDNGKALSGLEHEVEAVLEIDGQSLFLRKVYKEVWTKKRGSAQAEFTGHTTDYFIDSVPVQRAEYQSRVNGICDEQTFRLLTDVTCFNEQLHWQQRRKLLIDVCGDISDTDVIASKPTLKDLPVILGKRSLDDLRKIIQARRTEINRELDKIPVRIDEVERGLPDKSFVNASQLQTDIASFESTHSKMLQERAQFESGGGVAEKIKALREAEIAVLELEKQEHKASAAELSPLREQESKWLKEQARIEGWLKDLPIQITRNQEALTRLEAQREKLRAEWQIIFAETFTPSASDTCPACGQGLPEEAVQEANDKAQSKFNYEKAVRLEQVTIKGKTIKREAEDRQRDMDALAAEITKWQAELVVTKDMLSRLAVKINEINQGQQSADRPSQAMLEARDRVKELQVEVQNLRECKFDAMVNMERDISKFSDRLQELRAVQGRIKLREAGLARIDELKAEQKRLSAEFERLEQELYLTEEFIRAKVALLEERINSRFKLARFKLFDVQVNGAVAECCETTFGGVPYGSGLNKGARINVGLDIINTLSGHYNFAPPVWIDNAESVVELLPTLGQLIRLVVSGEDKILRLEVQEREAVLA